jgi:conjugal transfer pilus assembly protein TraD
MLPALFPTLRPRKTTFALGRRPGIARRSVSVSESELLHHMLVLGTTGSGKTTAAMTLLCQAVAAGWGVVLIDLKGDPDNAGVLAAAAQAARTTYRQFSITPGERCDRWEPLESGDPAARMSKVICLSEWSEPYYRTACERFTQLAFVLAERNGIVPTLAMLTELLDTPALAGRLARALPAAEQEPVERYLSRLLADSGQMSALTGLAARIGTLTDLGGPLRSQSAVAKIDLLQLSQEGGVCVFSLNSARSATTAAQIGALAVLDVQSMVAERIATGSCPQPVLVCVDEFSALDADHLMGLFARARSSRVGMMLATQELSDLTRVRIGFAEQIIGLTNTKLLLRQEVADSADTLAQLAGTQADIKRTRQRIRGTLTSSHSGVESEREVERFVVHPNTFKRLGKGQAVLLRKDPFRCERVNITPRVPEPLPATRVTAARTAERPVVPPPDRAETVEELDALFNRSS